jgi:nitrite reductase/ring-hydroxylating ferredoxin subunit
MKSYRIFKSAEEASQRIPLNSLVKISVAGKMIFMAHTPKGFFAGDDACPHRGGSLSKGTLNYLNEVICPLHSYRYNLQYGTETSQRSADLVLYAVETKDDGVYVTIP